MTRKVEFGIRKTAKIVKHSQKGAVLIDTSHFKVRDRLLIAFVPVHFKTLENTQEETN